MSPQQKGYISMDNYNIITPSSKDNGSEFARYADIERKPGSKEKRLLYTLADLTILVIVQAMKTAMDLFVDSSKKVLISTPSI